MNNEKVREVPIDNISSPRTPIRSRYDQGRLEQLAGSIRNVGVVTPLILRPYKEGYEVVVGHRRLAAARMVGLPAVPAIVRKLSGFGVDTLRLHENLSREDINPLDEAQFFSGLMEKHNVSMKELAKKIHRSSSYIRARLKILEWDSAVQEALSSGKVPLSSAHWLNKIEPETIRRDYLKYAISGGITTVMAKAWYKASRKDRLPSEPDEEKLKEIPKEERKHYYKTSCTICGELVSLEEQGIFTGHESCVRQLKEVIARAEKKKPETATKREPEKREDTPEAQKERQAG